MFGRKKQPALTPPPGMGAADIRVEKSICTGEATIGFYDPRTGRLLRAVAVRSPGDIAEFYRSYGFAPPGQTPNPIGRAPAGE